MFLNFLIIINSLTNTFFLNSLVTYYIIFLFLMDKVVLDYFHAIKYAVEYN